jgi:hypothetical protein
MSSSQTENPRDVEVDRFILDQIDSVPHIEALLILWNNRPHSCTDEELARLLFLPEDRTHQILADLVQRSLVQTDERGCSAYNPAHSRDHLMEDVDRTWRRELVRVSNMIHSKGSPAVREFARAFRFRKDKP